MAKPLEKLYPKEQALFEELLLPEDLEKIREAQDGTAFELVDDDIETAYGCPSCGYEWSGNPKPARAK